MEACKTIPDGDPRCPDGDPRCPVGPQERQSTGVADEQCGAVGGYGSQLSAHRLEALAAISILHLSPLKSTKLNPPLGPKCRINDGG